MKSGTLYFWDQGVELKCLGTSLYSHPRYYRQSNSNFHTVPTLHSSSIIQDLKNKAKLLEFVITNQKWFQFVYFYYFKTSSALCMLYGNPCLSWSLLCSSVSNSTLGPQYQYNPEDSVVTLPYLLSRLTPAALLLRCLRYHIAIIHLQTNMWNIRSCLL